MANKISMKDCFDIQAAKFRLPYRSQGVPIDDDERTKHSPNKRSHVTRGAEETEEGEERISQSEIDQFNDNIKNLGAT